MAPTQFPKTSPDVEDEVETSENLPITSYPCRWKAPRKRKESNLKLSDAKFEKRVWKEEKVTLSSIQDFDPRPAECRGMASTELRTLLGKVRGKGLGVLLLFNPSARVRMKQSSLVPLESPELPSRQQLEMTVSHFRSSLQVAEQRAREVERNTWEQHLSSEWYSVR